MFPLVVARQADGVGMAMLLGAAATYLVQWAVLRRLGLSGHYSAVQYRMFATIAAAGVAGFLVAHVIDAGMASIAGTVLAGAAGSVAYVVTYVVVGGVSAEERTRLIGAARARRGR
jgi:hypothetical protein